MDEVMWTFCILPYAVIAVLVNVGETYNMNSPSNATANFETATTIQKYDRLPEESGISLEANCTRQSEGMQELNTNNTEIYITGSSNQFEGTQESNTNNKEMSNETGSSKQFEDTQESNMNNTDMSNETGSSNQFEDTQESNINNTDMSNETGSTNQFEGTEEPNINNTDMSNETGSSNQFESTKETNSNTGMPIENDGSHQNNSISSLQFVTCHNETNCHGHFTFLIYKDDVFNDSLVVVWNHNESFANLEFGKDVFNETEEDNGRRIYGNHIGDRLNLKVLSTKNKNFCDLFSENELPLEQGFTKPEEMKFIFTLFTTVHEISSLKDRNESNCFNISAPYNFNFTDGLTNDTERCSMQQESAISDLKEMLATHNLTGYFKFRWDNISYFISEGWVCLEGINNESENKTAAEDYNTEFRLGKMDGIFRYYVTPVVYALILVLGTIGNGTLILMFFRWKNLRIPSNIIIFNLAVADIIHLFIAMPLYYIVKYYSEWIYSGGYGCKAYSSFRFLIHSVIMLSVLALSIQRYCATFTIQQRRNLGWKLSERSNAMIYIIPIWLVSMVLALPPPIFFDFRNGSCSPYANSRSDKILIAFYLILFCFVLPIMMGFFSILTARRLILRARRTSGGVGNSFSVIAMDRSAKVVVALAFAYALCYSPRGIWFFLMSYFHFNRTAPNFIIIDEVTNYLAILNSCLNPIALYIASENFRRLFKRYLLCYRQSEIRGENIMESKINKNSNVLLSYFLKLLPAENSHTGQSQEERNTSEESRNGYV